MHKYPDVMKIAHEKKHPSFDRGTLVPSHINGTLQTLHKKRIVGYFNINFYLQSNDNYNESQVI